MLALKPTVTAARTPTTSDMHALTQEWRANIAARLSASTAKAYLYALDHYLRYLADAQLEPNAATTNDITQYVAHCRAHRRILTPRRLPWRPVRGGCAAPLPPCAPMLRVRLTVLRSFYDALVARGHCSANPLRGGVRLNRLARGEQSVRALRPVRASWTLTGEQVTALASTLAQTSARDRLLVALLCDTGLPPSELCALSVHDVRLHGQVLTVKAPHHSSSARGASAILCTPVTTQLYRRYMRARSAARGVTEALFVSQSYRNAGQGISVSMVDKTLRSIGRRAGVSGLTSTNLRRVHAQPNVQGRGPDGAVIWLDASPSQRRKEPDTAHMRLLSALFGGQEDGFTDADTPDVLGAQ